MQENAISPTSEHSEVVFNLDRKSGHTLIKLLSLFNVRMRYNKCYTCNQCSAVKVGLGPLVFSEARKEALDVSTVALPSLPVDRHSLSHRFSDSSTQQKRLVGVDKASIRVVICVNRGTERCLVHSRIETRG